MKRADQSLWNSFKKSFSGMLALWTFCTLLIISLFADFIANERPLVVCYKGSLYAPIFVDYPETTFGGEYDTVTDYLDPKTRDHILQHGWMVFPPIPYSHDTVNRDLLGTVPSAPNRHNWLGTDEYGRDLLTGLIYGLRTTLFFGLGVAILSGLLGFILGALQGYYGGYTDLFGQRVTEVWASLPLLIVFMILSSLFEPGILLVFLLLILFKWMMMASVMRAEFLKLKRRPYILAAQMMHIPSHRILWRHILPNAMGSCLVLMPLLVIAAISSLTTLDYLGFGLPPGSASLGELLHQGKNNLHAPWIGISGVFVLGALMICLVLMAQTLRRCLDPYQTPMVDTW